MVILRAMSPSVELPLAASVSVISIAKCVSHFGYDRQSSRSCDDGCAPVVSRCKLFSSSMLWNFTCDLTTYRRYYVHLMKDLV